MAEYYLISQLPSLDGIGENSPVPITEERFMELCEGSLKKKALSELKNIKLIPTIDAEKSHSSLVENWNNGERNLRFALAKIRAERMNKSFDLGNQYLPAELFKVAGDVMEIKNPLEAEKFLLQYRLRFLETIRPMDNFSEDFIFYYGLKLKLILRIRQFDTQVGEATYKNIYNSILNR
ncbi:MAG: DUF2764 family protein [Acutalibacteraceae bacterium]|nr:DUF2764 family protein [Acutalibacteraceae bacterium]